MCTCQNAKTKKARMKEKVLKLWRIFQSVRFYLDIHYGTIFNPPKSRWFFFCFFFFFLLHGVDLENESIVAIDSRYSGNALATFGKRGEGRDINLLLFLPGLTYFSVQKRNADERTSERTFIHSKKHASSN